MRFEKGRHALKGVVKRELREDLNKDYQTDDWSGPLTPEMRTYAARDAEVLLPLHEILMDKVKRERLERIAGIENRALPAITRMAEAGVPFDAEGWKECLKRVEEERDRLKEQLNELAPEHPKGKEWNWNSPDQIREALKWLGIFVPDTKEKTLARCDHPLAKTLIRYRKASRTTSTNGPKFLSFVRADGRIYADWHQIGAETGRMSCSKPNLQNLPPEVRRYVRVAEGRRLVKADYSQIELRILARFSGDTALLGAFRRGEDLHKATAANMLGIPLEEVTDDHRKAAKTINFGLIYGMTHKGLAARLGIDEEKAQGLMARYFAAYPKVKNYLDAVSEKAIRTGELRTLSGRIRRFGDTSLLDSAEIQAVQREAKNFPIQGTSADGLKLAMALFHERLPQHLDAKLIITLHDELVVECPETQAEEVAEFVEEIMISGMEEIVNQGLTDHPDHVPIEADVSIYRSWDGD
jgi:DNA polymerase-1